VGSGVGPAQRAAGAGRARRPGGRAGRPRSQHSGVGQPAARALRRPDRPRHAVPAVPGAGLPDQPGRHVRPAPHAVRRAAEPVVHRVPDAAVRAADGGRHDHRLRDRPVPGDTGLPAVPGPVLPGARRARPVRRDPRVFRRRVGSRGRPGGGGARRPARLGRGGAVHRLLHLHPAPAGPGRARRLPAVHLPGAGGQHRQPGRHRRPVRDRRGGHGRSGREPARGGQQGLGRVLRVRDAAGHQPAQHPGRSPRGCS